MRIILILMCLLLAGCGRQVIEIFHLENGAKITLKYNSQEYEFATVEIINDEYIVTLHALKGKNDIRRIPKETL